MLRTRVWTPCCVDTSWTGVGDGARVRGGWGGGWARGKRREGKGWGRVIRRRLRTALHRRRRRPYAVVAAAG
jgi:hypothetical protein